MVFMKRWLLAVGLVARSNNAFSASSKIQSIKSTLIDSASLPNADVTSLPLGTSDCTSINYSTEFVSQQIISIDSYTKFVTSRHEDCISLFDSYSTSLVRCELLDEASMNIRWNATWIPVGSNWLYELANFMSWEVTTKSPDPSRRVVFSWKIVFDMFVKAFSTGEIVLPVMLVEGNTLIRVTGNEKTAIATKESIDLVADSDKNRLQNRRVAQELASWLDVRRPPRADHAIDADEWASTVRQRILSGVEGAGLLDIDPNEEGEAGIAIAIFGVVSLAVLALSFQFFAVPEIVGGVGSVPAKCDDAEILEMGSGYLSECFGPFGDPAYTK